MLGGAEVLLAFEPHGDVERGGEGLGHGVGAVLGEQVEEVVEGGGVVVELFVGKVQGGHQGFGGRGQRPALQGLVARCSSWGRRGCSGC